VIEACRETGRSVAVMSVHCAEAVETVLGLSDLRPWTGPVIGRDHIKATTWDFHTITDLVRVTVQAVGEEPANCAVVGLSVAAMYAAREVGACGIGVVNQHANRKHLAIFEAAVVPSLPALTTVHPTT
jgi:beta-phosphoglucomutase-like phosphatase (HAD superfamily)